MHILVIEDDALVRQALKLMLTAQGHTMSMTDLCEEGRALARSHTHDLIMSDVNLPDGNGVETLELLRAEGDCRPIIIMSASSRMETGMRALRASADAFLSKPFTKIELYDALSRALARAGQAPLPPRPIGGILLQDAARQLATTRDRVSLTEKEYEVLALLLEYAPATVSFETFLERLYENKRRPTTGTVEVCIANLRKKFKALVPGADYIKNDYGVGFFLVVPA